MEEVLWATGFHGAARSLYRVTVGSRRGALVRSMTNFYRTQLIPGCLVFDIGANVGVLSEVFTSVGAVVVAVEPNSDCVRHIQISYGDQKLEVIQAAVGAQNGLAVLNISDDRDDLSSISQEWMRVLEREHGEYKGLWNHQITVPVIALDSLVERYGLPHYIKIDVEGFEEHVLDGLSSQPPLLSFEFNTACPDVTMRCLDKTVFAAQSTFNYTFGDPVRFELVEWVKRDELKTIMGKMEQSETHGDVFVRGYLSGPE